MVSERQQKQMKHSTKCS